MASISSFIRKTPASSLKAYFASKPYSLPSSVDWAAAESDVASALIEAVGALSELEREKLIREVNRITALADEPGQNALRDVVTNPAHFDALVGSYNRALWVFLNEDQSFNRAEEVRYNDGKRRGRMWSGYVVDSNRLIRKDQFAKDAFISDIRERFQTKNVHVDVFDRHRVTFDGKTHDLVQVAVYREGRPDDELGFNGAGKLDRLEVRPVYEAVLTYEPREGVIEVVASDKEMREFFAGLMSRHLLDIDFKNEKLPPRVYDLSVLLVPFVFTTDPNAPPGEQIESVHVKELRLQPLDNPDQRITLECGGAAGDTIWDMADRHIGPGPLRQADWRVTRATLVVYFVPQGRARRGKVLNLTITVPHGCNLKSLTAKEQLIGEKYLRNWKILKGGAKRDAADRP